MAEVRGEVKSRALLTLPYKTVVNPQQNGGCQTHSSYSAPDQPRTVQHFSEMMEQHSAEPSANERPDPDRQKCESHICALLAGWREP